MMMMMMKTEVIVLGTSARQRSDSSTSTRDLQTVSVKPATSVRSLRVAIDYTCTRRQRLQVLLLPSTSHSQSYFGRHGKAYCLLNGPRKVGLLQLSPLRHVGCESSQPPEIRTLRECDVNVSKLFNV